MKHIKKFELNLITVDHSGKYWLVPSEKNKLKIALQKLKCPNIFSDKMNGGRTVVSEDFNRDYIFISNSNSNIIDSFGEWGWNPYKGMIPDDFYEGEGYSFAGKIIVTDEEVAVNKYNL